MGGRAGGGGGGSSMFAAPRRRKEAGGGRLIGLPGPRPQQGGRGGGATCDLDGRAARRDARGQPIKESSNQCRHSSCRSSAAQRPAKIWRLNRWRRPALRRRGGGAAGSSGRYCATERAPISSPFAALKIFTRARSSGHSGGPAHFGANFVRKASPDCYANKRRQR